MVPDDTSALADLDGDVLLDPHDGQSREPMPRKSRFICSPTAGTNRCGVARATGLLMFDGIGFMLASYHKKQSSPGGSNAPGEPQSYSGVLSRGVS